MSMQELWEFVNSGWGLVLAVVIIIVGTVIVLLWKNVHWHARGVTPAAIVAAARRHGATFGIFVPSSTKQRWALVLIGLGIAVVVGGGLAPPSRWFTRAPAMAEVGTWSSDRWLVLVAFFGLLVAIIYLLAEAKVAKTLVLVTIGVAVFMLLWTPFLAWVQTPSAPVTAAVTPFRCSAEATPGETRRCYSPARTARVVNDGNYQAGVYTFCWLSPQNGLTSRQDGPNASVVEAPTESFDLAYRLVPANYYEPGGYNGGKCPRVL